MDRRSLRALLVLTNLPTRTSRRSQGSRHRQLLQTTRNRATLLLLQVRATANKPLGLDSHFPRRRTATSGRSLVILQSRATRKLPVIHLPRPMLLLKTATQAMHRNLLLLILAIRHMAKAGHGRSSTRRHPTSQTSKVLSMGRLTARL